MAGICKELKGNIRPDAKAISLIKGMEVNKDGFQLISEYIKANLNIDCSVISFNNTLVVIVVTHAYCFCYDGVGADGCEPGSGDSR